MENRVEILERLADSRYWVRLLAVRQLVEAGDAGLETQDILFGLLEGAGADLRTSAVEALYELRQTNPAILPRLMERLEHPAPEVRWRVVWVLGRPRECSPEIVPAILGRLGDADPEVRARAATALGKLRVETCEVISALVAAVAPEDDDSWANDKVREEAAEALGKLDCAATPNVAAALFASFREFNCRGGRQGHRVMAAVHRLVQRSPDLLETLRDWARDGTHEHQYYSDSIVVRYPESHVPSDQIDRQEAHGQQDEHYLSDATHGRAVDVGSLLVQLREQLVSEMAQRILVAVRAPESFAFGNDIPLDGDPWWPEIYPPAMRELIDSVRNDGEARKYLFAHLPRQDTVAQAVIAAELIHAPAAVETHRSRGSGRTIVINQYSIHQGIGGQELRPLLLRLLSDTDALVRRLALAGLSTLDGCDPLGRASVLNLKRGVSTPDRHLDWWNNASSLGDVARWMEACGEATVALLEAARQSSNLQSEAASRALMLRTPASLECAAILSMSLRSAQIDLFSVETQALSDLGLVAPGFLGVAAPTVIDALLARRDDPDDRQRQYALMLLCVASPAEASVLERLQAWLYDRTAYLRRAALYTLTEVAGDRPLVIQAIQERLSSDPASSQHTAEMDGESVLELDDRGTDEEQHMRREAIQAAKSLGLVPLSLFEAVRDCLHAADNWGETMAQEAFVALKVRDPGPPDAWWERLQGGGPWARLTAAKILIQLGQRDPKITDALLDVLQLSDRSIGKVVYALLREHGDADPRVVTTLLERLPSDDHFGNGPAYALAGLGIANAEVVEALYAQLEADETVYEGHPTVVALPLLASKHPAVAATLRQRLAARFTDLPASFAALLDTLPDAAYVSMLMAYITRDWDDTSWTRWREAAALGGLQDRDPAITAALLRHLEQSVGDNLQEAVIHALIRRGDGSPAVMEALRLRLKDPTSWVRRMAAAALGHLRPRDASQRPVIIESLLETIMDDDLSVCSAAARMLARLAAGDQRVQQAARTRLERLHGPETATMLLQAIEDNPTGQGFEHGPRPRAMREESLGNRWIMSERLMRVRWR